jgi:hypothetical protein
MTAIVRLLEIEVRESLKKHCQLAHLRVLHHGKSPVLITKQYFAIVMVTKYHSIVKQALHLTIKP